MAFVRSACGIGGLLVALLAGNPAYAHPLIDRGIEEASQANFEAALAAFAEAHALGELTQQETIVLLSERALVFHALGDLAHRDEDLRSLAALDPEHVFSERHPSELVETFQTFVPADTSPAAEGSHPEVTDLPRVQVERDPQRGSADIVRPPRRASRRGLWIGVSLSIVGVAAATVATVLLVGGKNSSTLLREPRVDFE